jgi:hypothetical protein
MDSKMVMGGSVEIKVNDDIGPYLFNIVADMIALLINRVKVARQLRGVIPHLVDDGLSVLQYANDTIIFLDHDLEQAKNLKLLLCAFE